ncbi:MAG: hypothetical protein Q8T09_01940 [Candidatus Melainabacteria bacterium]|nr:hypothetical protein [Candidatus Melainabacteria bacterium]
MSNSTNYEETSYEDYANRAALSVQRFSAAAVSNYLDNSAIELSNYYSERSSVSFNPKLALNEALFGITSSEPVTDKLYQSWVKDLKASNGIF